jgi:hypothetical protein
MTIFDIGRKNAVAAQREKQTNRAKRKGATEP